MKLKSVVTPISDQECHHQSQSPFFNLPLEIQQLIYEQVILSEAGVYAGNSLIHIVTGAQIEQEWKLGHRRSKHHPRANKISANPAVDQKPRYDNHARLEFEWQKVKTREDSNEYHSVWWLNSSRARSTPVWEFRNPAVADWVLRDDDNSSGLKKNGRFLPLLLTCRLMYGSQSRSWLFMLTSAI
jgi:hypothetical protein